MRHQYQVLRKALVEHVLDEPECIGQAGARLNTLFFRARRVGESSCDDVCRLARARPGTEPDTVRMRYPSRFTVNVELLRAEPDIVAAAIRQRSFVVARRLPGFSMPPNS